MDLTIFLVFADICCSDKHVRILHILLRVDKVRLDSIIIIAYYKKILDFGVMEIGCSEYDVTKSDQSFPLCFLFKLSFKIVLFRAKHSRMSQAEFFRFCLPKPLLGPFLNAFSHLSHSDIL